MVGLIIFLMYIDPSIVGNMHCDLEVNTENCRFDGGDCCPVLGPDFSDGEFFGGKICFPERFQQL